MINPRLKTLAEKMLPRLLVGWLDPFQQTIEAEVRTAAAEITDGEIALDAGAGEAHHRKCFTRGTYFALDSGAGDPSWDYGRLDICGDLEDIPLRAMSVDTILCMVVLEHTRRPRHVIEEFARVLKPGGRLYMVVPFLWEEHQTPHDYFRFTRHGVELLFEELPVRIDLLRPVGGFFWLAARRCINLLGFFQGGWRWLLFVPLAPFFGLLFPVVLHFLDALDPTKTYSLGFQLRATKVGRL